MEKSIYKIVNLVNGKAYIGQTTNEKNRWKCHVSCMRSGVESPLYNEMREYGLENFSFIVLKRCVKNFDQCEQEYIKQYNSLYPNGYNLVKGGNGQGKVEELIPEIIHELRHSKRSIKALAKDFNLSRGTLSDINLGRKYRQTGIDYPIRPNHRAPRNLSKELVKQIHVSLKYERDKGLKDIQEEYGISSHILKEINYGLVEVYRIPGNVYPLRDERINQSKMSFEECQSIIDMLEDTQLSKAEIARVNNVSVNFVTRINNGVIFRDDTKYVYPIRSGNESAGVAYRTCLSPNELREIERLLIEAKISMREIAQRYGMTVAALGRLNNGRIKKYYSSANKYPLRPKGALKKNLNNA